MKAEKSKTGKSKSAELTLSDFCNMDEFEKILSDWTITSHMSAIVRDVNHKYITEKYGFTDYCKMIISSENGYKECVSCDEDANIFCCHAGLCDFSLPVTLPDGKTIAYIFCGQTKSEDASKPDFKKLSSSYNLNSAKLQSEYKKITVKTKEEIEAAKALLSATINSFVSKNYEKWLSQNENQDDKTLSQITQILYAYNITLDLETGKYTLITGTGLERLVSIYKKYSDYTAAQNRAKAFVHPAYEKQLNELLTFNNLKNYADRNGHIDSIEYPVLYSDSDDYEWHEVNVFASHNNSGKPIINILGRDVTEAHRIQEKNSREIRAAAARNQILSDLTKMLYSYNITLNLNTGKFSLIEGTGMTKFMEIFKSTDDYPTAYKEKIDYILPEYYEQFSAIASIEALRGHRNNHGFIGSLEYGARTDHGEEWHEINIFISSDEFGNPIANILGRDITEAHKRQEQREIAQKASAARDQLLSGVTKMLYSFNVTVSLNTWKYSLITGTGCEPWIQILQASDDYVLIVNKIRKLLDKDSVEVLENLCDVQALKNCKNRSGFIGTVTTSTTSGENKNWQEINLFMGTNEYGEPTANILGRDITELQLRQEEKENELKASAAKDQILSEITKSLYSYNLTINLETGKYSLITGTGMEDFIHFLKNEGDYNRVYEYAIGNVDPDYSQIFENLMLLENLKKKSVLNGHIGRLEYAANGKHGTEWHEVNVFISTNENGDVLANILGRDVTEAHLAQERRENELRAVAAKDQILSEITKTLYSYNLTLNLNSGKYSLILGTGMKNFVQIFEATDDYETAFEKKIKYVSDDFKDAFTSFTSLSALRSRTEEKGYIGTLEYSANSGTGIEWHEINIFIGTNENGEPIANILGRDITEAHDRADTKAKLKIAEASSKSKTQFLFNMSHDIRTPMNAIIGFTDLLAKHLDDKELARNYISKIKYSNEFLLSLINNVLEMARIESGKEILDEEECNIYEFNDTLEAVFSAQMKEKNLDFSIETRIEHFNIVGDKTKTKEIFLNLLSNAYKYTPAGGKVKMEAVEIPSEKPGYVTIKTTITDTGIGMSKDFLPHLFEEFAREHNSTESKVIGTGLGMSIVKNLVNLMHGTIDVESELGKGTTYTIILTHRISENAAGEKSSEQNTAQKNVDFNGKRILLAEDNELNAEIAMTILEELGIEVDNAADGVVCVDMLQKADCNYYNAVLMDIQMPNMDGYKAARVIREMKDPVKNKIPIIAMTANAFEEDRKNAMAAGMNGHLAKPIDIAKLMETLTQIL